MREHFNNFFIKIEERVSAETIEKNYIMQTDELYEAIRQSNPDTDEFMRILGMRIKRN